MSSEPAISIKGLGKRYKLGGKGRFGRVLSSLGIGKGSEFWALKDVSFDVGRGEVVGLVGRNGAGKSTLLKILSRITEPTEGCAEIRGTMGSLLEVGTGFHPELTGRENVYLNGSILGMRRKEIERKFDRIVEFSEIGKFLDTPVKHYSSGMYVRLAFSVAVHMEPDILVVDEVLAVGDASFQRKCLRKVGQMRQDGHTILLVSHDLNTVRGVCNRAAWLLGGKVQQVGAVEDVAQAYRQWSLAEDERMLMALQQPSHRETEGNDAEIALVRVLSMGGEPIEEVATGEPVRIEVTLDSRRRFHAPVLGFGIERADGFHCYGCTTEIDNLPVPDLDGRMTFEIRIAGFNLAPGNYRVTTGLWDSSTGAQVDCWLDGAWIRVVSERADHGAFFLPHEWVFGAVQAEE